MLRYLLVAGFVLSVLLQSVSSTTCSPKTKRTCTDTQDVKGVCGNGVCMCDMWYVPVETGCASSSSLPRPTLTAVPDHLSGEIFVTDEGLGQMRLSCNTPLSDVEYKWYQGHGDVIDGQTGSEFVVTDIKKDANLVYSCQVLASDLASEHSNSFHIKAYTQQGTISERPKVEDMPDNIMEGATFSIKCSHLPKDSSVTVTWDDPDQTQKNDFEFKNVQSSDYRNGIVSKACTIKRDGPMTILNEKSETAVGYIKAASEFEIEMLQGVENANVSQNQAGYRLECRVRGSHALPTNVPSWTWKADDTLINGAIKYWYTVPTDTPQTVTYACVAKFQNDVIKSVEKKVTVSSTVLQESHIVVIPRVPPDEGYMRMKCLIRADGISDVEYSWTHKEKVIIGQKDHTLQMDVVTQRNHGGAYTCTATRGDAEAKSPIATVTVKEMDNVIVFTRPALDVYILGTTYTFTCVTESWSPGITYEWHKDDRLVGTVSTYTVKATDISVELKCRVKFVENYKDSEPFMFQGKVTVKVDGPKIPVIGTSASYYCVVGRDRSSPIPIFKWFEDQQELTGETKNLLTLSTVAAEDNKAYKCCAKVGNDPELCDTINLVPLDKPSKPQVTSNAPDNELHKSGTYTLTCTTLSEEAGISFQWWKYVQGHQGDMVRIPKTETNGKTYTLYDANEDTVKGAFMCRAIINEKLSDLSDPLQLKYFDKKGKKCIEIADCIESENWEELYTGHCIDEVCQCVRGRPLTPDACGGVSSSLGLHVPVILGIVVGVMVFQYMI